MRNLNEGALDFIIFAEKTCIIFKLCGLLYCFY